MSEEIFLLTPDNQLHVMRETGYVSEDRLQELLESHPQLIPGDPISPTEPRRWLLIGREFGVPSSEDGGNRWSIDHLFLDQEGIPTLVEVKRSSDTRIRREVVGQMLDYAANGVAYWPPDELRRLFEEAGHAGQRSPEARLEDFLGAQGGYEAFWDRVRTNLQARRIRLVFIADRIPPELRRVVEFLNEQMNSTEVLAVEIRQFAGPTATTLVPRIIGKTASAERAKGHTPRVAQNKWDEESFFAALSQGGSQSACQVARDLLSWAYKKCDWVWWGEGTRQGSFVPTIQHHGVKHQLYAVLTTGDLELYFSWYRRKEPFVDPEARLELVRRLNQISGLAILPDDIERRPYFRLDALATPDRLGQFCDVFDWFCARVRSLGSNGNTA